MKDLTILKPNSNEYQVTAENYVVPKGEEGKYHAIIEVPQFSQADGSRLSKPRIQKFGQKWFESMDGESNLKKQGFKIIILHNPKEWLSKNAALDQEQKALKAKEAADAKAKAEQEKIDQEKAERDAEIALAVEKAVTAALAAQAKATPAKAEPAKQPETKTDKPEVKEAKPEQKAATDADKK